MTDEPNGQSTNDDDRVGSSWVMPQPVFRSSEGVTPKNRADISEDATEVANVPDISEEPTEVANIEDMSDLPTEAANVADPAANASHQHETPTAERIRVIPPQTKTSKGGCALSALAIVGLIAVAVVGIALALVYYYYYYSAPVGAFD